MAKNKVTPFFSGHGVVIMTRRRKRSPTVLAIEMQSMLYCAMLR